MMFFDFGNRDAIEKVTKRIESDLLILSSNCPRIAVGFDNFLKLWTDLTVDDSIAATRDAIENFSADID